jgi:hypothetical protein
MSASPPSPLARESILSLSTSSSPNRSSNLKRSLKSSPKQNIHSSPKDLVRKLDSLEKQWSAEDCGWSWGGIGLKQNLELTTTHLPIGLILEFKINYIKRRVEKVYDSLDTSSTSSDQDGEDGADNRASKVMVKRGKIGGHSLSVSVRELEEAFRPSELDRVQVNCSLVTLHEYKVVCDIGCRHLLKSGASKRKSKTEWEMLAIPNHNTFKVLDTGYGYWVESAKPISCEKDVIIVQNLSTGKMLVGRTNEQSFKIYRRPLEKNADFNHLSTFHIILIAKDLTNPEYILANYGTIFARPLYSANIPFGYRLCSMPIYFKFEQTRMTITCLDPLFKEIFIVFFEKFSKTIIDAESGQFKTIIIHDPLEQYTSSKKSITLRLYPRTLATQGKSFIVKAYNRSYTPSILNDYIGYAPIPPDRIWQDIDKKEDI